MDREFYDLDIQSEFSSGDDSVEELAERAERLGFSGIAVSDYAAELEDLEEPRSSIREADTGIDLHLGVKLRPGDPEELGDMLQVFREETEVVVVHGGDADVNRAATGDTRVDILSHPDMERKDSGLDHVMAKQAAENNVAIEVNIRQLLETYGKVRSHVLSHMRRNMMLCQEFGAPVLASSGATSLHHLRAPRELAAFPQVLGMEVGESFETVSDVPRRILRRAERVTSEDFIRPGVTKAGEGDGDG
ncbi:MAG: ribonuclease P protein component 3 [Candidatus Nanohaloarchaea archaeon]